LDSLSKRSISNILKELVPLKLIDPILKLSGISPDKLGSQIDSSERNHLASVLKSVRFNIKSPLPMGTAMVTAGGVSLKEIDPRTLQSKVIKGLYFCGEVIDIAADTGGYNLQAAFSTGFVAGESTAEYVLKS
jgi:predicted Rossmann fold flavoprotein